MTLLYFIILIHELLNTKWYFFKQILKILNGHLKTLEKVGLGLLYGIAGWFNVELETQELIE